MKKTSDFSFEQFFKALADHTRLRVIHILGTDEVCVCSVVEALQTSQPKISRHLAYLRRAGLVSARREGKWMHYRVVEPSDSCAAEIFRDVRNGLDDPQMRRDRERLAQLIGKPGAHASGVQMNSHARKRLSNL